MQRKGTAEKPFKTRLKATFANFNLVYLKTDAYHFFNMLISRDGFNTNLKGNP
jgi:hypothetical protein